MLVGLIEGEGTISISKRIEKRYGKSSHGFYLRPYMDFTNTDVSIVLKYQSLIKKILHDFYKENCFQTTVGTLEHCKRKNGKWNTIWKIGYRIRLQDRISIIMVLNEIKDCLISKKERALLVYEWCVSRDKCLEKFRRYPYTQRELEIVDKIRVLNKRGFGR